MSQIDKRKLLKCIAYYESQYSASASAFDRGAQYIASRIKADVESEQCDAVDYQQRYETLVQAIHDFPVSMIVTSAANLINWMESVCPHFDEAYNAAQVGPSESTKRLMLEDDSND